MPTSPNDRTRLLNVESREEAVDYGNQPQPNDPPPPYQMVAGPSSIPYQSIPGQILVGNYQAPASNQSQPTMYGDYKHLSLATGQWVFAGGVSGLPPGQPIYVIPASAALLANNDTSLIPGNYRAPPLQPIRTQSRIIRTQARSIRTQPRRVREPEPLADEWNACWSVVLFFMTTATILFIVILMLSFFPSGR